MSYIKYETNDGQIITHNCEANITNVDLTKKNIIKIIEIKGLNNLRNLHLSDNQIQDFPLQNISADQLVNLRSLVLRNNKIQKIEGLNQLVNLRELWLEHNKIEKIEGLDQLVNLQTLLIGYNKIQKIEGLDQLVNLQELWLEFNQIQKIEGLDQLVNLQALYMDYNKIQFVPLSIMNLKQLVSVNVDCELDPIIERYLSRNRIKISKTIFSDGQNVHDTTINRSICDSLYRIMEEKIDITNEIVLAEILNDDSLDEMTKKLLIEYASSNDVHSISNVTFMEALKYVWWIIRNHKDNSTIKVILNQEMNDAICKCFTGRMSRLVNVLNGFDPRVSIKISDNSEISNIIINVKNRISDIVLQKEQIIKELEERGYTKEIIDEWLAYLD